MIGKFKNVILRIFPVRLFNFVIMRCKKEISTEDDDLFVHSMKNLALYNRDDYLIKCCTGKRVLHFGFLDYPITREKIEKCCLLHQKISKVACSLYGIDIDQESLKLYREVTGDSENQAHNYLNNESDISSFANKYDVILFPEILEHLLNPGIAIEKLRQICLLNHGSKIVITVPNAYSLQHFVSAFNGIEFVHRDHYYYFSPVTLRKLLQDTGFQDINISMYSWSAGNFTPNGITENGVIAVCNA